MRFYTVWRWSGRGEPRRLACACVPDRAQNSRGASPRARYARSRRRGHGKGAHREVGSEGSRSPKMRGDAQAPDMRCGTPGTSGHATTQSSIRGGVCVIHPAFTHQKFCVLLREVCMVSTSKVWRKSRGTAGKPGGNREHKPHPVATTWTERGEIASERHAEVSRGYSKPGAGNAREAPHGRKAGQQIGRAATRAG